MNKMVINHLEKLFITSDAATIIKETDVHHPAAKMIAQAAKMQENECGDGTNLLISMAGELMTQAQSLITMGLHPSEILIGYEKAAQKSIELLDNIESYSSANLRDEAELTRMIKATVASKQFGLEDFLAGLISKAAIYSMPQSNIGGFSTENVRVQKILGGGIFDSEVVHGMVVTRGSMTSVRKCTDCKVAVYNTNIEMQQGETKGTVLMKNAEDLLNYTKGEEDAFEAWIKGLAEAGIQVVVGSGSMSELAQHYFEKYKIYAVKIMSKWELKRIARAVGATPIVKLVVPSPDELGFANEVSFKEISSTWCTIFRRDQDENKMATILLRGSTSAMLEDTERAIDNGVSTVKTIIRNSKMVAGAGATELWIGQQIQKFAKEQPGLDQYAVEKFGTAFEIIPRTLAENSGHKAEAVLADMYAKGVDSSAFGFDCSDGEVKNAMDASIFDAWETKSWALKLCFDVVITILRVDQIIMSKPSGGPKMDQAARRPDGYDE
jgi:T-complex protein 1 subunit theta